MSYNVQYVIAAEDFDAQRFTALTSEPVPEEESDGEFKIDTGSEEIQCMLSRDSGVFVLWTKINYYRFLYEKEHSDSVAFFDQWVLEFAPTAVRADESLVQEWSGVSFRESPGESFSSEKFVAWLRDEDPEGTHWALQEALSRSVAS